MNITEATARCWAEIDMEALLQNYRTARAMLAPSAEIIPVLKANAYGCGAKTAAKALYNEGAKCFAVACMAEAEELKHAVPDADVLILGLVGAEECVRAVKEKFILTVFSERSAQTVIEAARSAGICARVHWKVETGLHRIGWQVSEIPKMLAFAAQKEIHTEGIFTHLALRDRASDEKQFAAFDAVLTAFRKEGYMRLTAHVCDSIGMVRYPERHMDAVRTGAWLYGVCPYRYEHPEKCLCVMTLKARIAQIRVLPQGECVGYDDEHPLCRETRVATLSAGYVDGFFRFNNAGEVVIRGKRASVLGLVCMDQMMVDVSDIPEADEGDEAILFGGPIRVDEYAANAHMNRNEALSRVGRRVPRIYIWNGRTEVTEPEIR